MRGLAPPTGQHTERAPAIIFGASHVDRIKQTNKILSYIVYFVEVSGAKINEPE